MDESVDYLRGKIAALETANRLLLAILTNMTNIDRRTSIWASLEETVRLVNATQEDVSTEFITGFETTLDEISNHFLKD